MPQLRFKQSTSQAQVQSTTTPPNAQASLMPCHAVQWVGTNVQRSRLPPQKPLVYSISISVHIFKTGQYPSQRNQAGNNIFYAKHFY